MNGKSVMADGGGVGGVFESDRRVAEVEGGRPHFEEVNGDGGRLAAGSVDEEAGMLGDQRHAARPARDAAVDAGPVWLRPLERGEIAPLRSVRALGGSEMIEEGAFEGVGETGFAGESEELGIELNPGGGDASFADVGGGMVGEFEIAVEMFALGGTAGQVKPARHDVIPGDEYRREPFAFAGGAGQLAEADEIRKHLIALGICGRGHGFFTEERGNDFWAVRFVISRDEVTGKLEVAGVAGGAVEEDDRFEHAGGGHADMGAGVDDAFFVGAECADEEIADPDAGIEGVNVTGVLMVGEQPDEVVFMDPDIPVGTGEEAEALIGGIGSQVAIGFLSGDELADHAIEFRAQFGIAGVAPGQSGGVQPLAHMFADPGVAPRPIAKARQQGFLVNLQQAVERVVLSAKTEETVEGDGRRGWQLEDVR
jgi:hypothetical protein